MEKIVNAVVAQTSECSSGPHAPAVCPPDLRHWSGPTTAVAHAASVFADAPATFLWIHESPTSSLIGPPFTILEAEPRLGDRQGSIL